MGHDDDADAAPRSLLRWLSINLELLPSGKYMDTLNIMQRV